MPGNDSSRLGMAVSDDTLLRTVKCGALASTAAALHVIGIDDWAWQKGQHHDGTIVVDVERRRVVDVLAVRTADAVAAWLSGSSHHPHHQPIDMARMPRAYAAAHRRRPRSLIDFTLCSTCARRSNGNWPGSVVF